MLYIYAPHSKVHRGAKESVAGLQDSDIKLMHMANRTHARYASIRRYRDAAVCVQGYLCVLFVHLDGR